MKHFQTGSAVEWNWGSGVGSGKVVEIFTDKVTRTIKDNKVTRNASQEEPAYLVRQDDGDRVLKSHSELTKKDGASNR